MMTLNADVFYGGIMFAYCKIIYAQQVLTYNNSGQKDFAFILLNQISILL